MNRTDLNGTWNEQKWKFMTEFAVLTDSEPLVEKSKKEDTPEELQARRDKTREELMKIIEAL